MKNKVTLFSLILFLCFEVSAQENQLTYNELKKITDVDKIKKSDILLIQEAADAHFYNCDYESALPFYQALVDFNVEMTPEDIYHYGQCLKTKGMYAEAEKQLELFAKASNKQFTPYNIDAYLADIQEQSGRYNLRPLTINSEESEFPTKADSLYIYYLSSRKGGDFNADLDMRAYDLWTANCSKDELVNAKKMESINSSLNEGGAAISKSGKMGFFTQNNPKTLQLNLVRAVKVNGAWEMKEPVHFCSNEFSVAEPVFSENGKQLYFVSNMPGGYGETDIYVVDVSEDGFTGEPKNLGPKINSISRENFPNFDTKGTLYFSSSGHNTLGGFDIFASKFNSKTNEFEVPLNVGEPVNSIYDDFAYVINKNNSGFFASNRKGGQGRDDIYGFLELTPLRAKGSLKMLKDAQALIDRLFPGGKFVGLIDVKDKDSYETESVFDEGRYFLIPKDSIMRGNGIYVPPNALLKSDLSYLSSQELELGKYYAFSKPTELLAKGEVVKESIEMKKNGLYDTENPLKSGSYYMIPKENLKRNDDKLAKNEIEVFNDSTYKSGDNLAVKDYYLLPNLAKSPQNKNANLGKINLINDGTYSSDSKINPGRYFLLPKGGDLLVNKDLVKDVMNVRADGSYFSKNKIESGGYYLIPREADMTNVLDVKNIYFDYNKSDVRTDAIIELTTVIKLLKDNEHLKVRMAAHADQRGSAEANIILSEKRAEQTKNYLVKLGIDENRIFWDAKGAAFPAKPCPNLDCDEAIYGANRRVEFVLFN